MIVVDAVAASCAAGSKKRSVFSGQAHLIRCFSRRLCSVLHDPADLLAFACSHECTTRDVTGFRPVSGEPLAQSEYMPQFQAPRSWTLCPLGFVAACSGSLALLLHVLAVLSYSIILSSNNLNWNRFKSNYLGLGGA